MTVCITANTRLARALRQAYDRQQIDAGLAVWDAPDILPFSAWIKRCWEAWLYGVSSTKAANPVQLLSPSQERAIWEGIVARSDAGNALLQVAPTADAALEAWNLLHAWHVPVNSRDWDDSRDTEAFRLWAQDFQRICDKRNWLPGASLPGFIAARMTLDEIPVPPHIQFAGFAEFTPAQQHLMEAMRRKGAVVELRNASPRHGQGSALRIGFPDTQQEIRAAARWSRKALESAEQAGKPEPSIGIVVPELSKYRSTIERLFAEELHPGGRMSPDLDSRRAFNISLGPALSEYPLIQSAFLILRMNPAAAMSLDDVLNLLRCPFIAKAQTESPSQASLDIHLRRLREPEMPLSEMMTHAPPGLASALQQWGREYAKAALRQMPGDWAAAFSNTLKAIGWPGERTLTSSEYQTTTAWNEMLSEFSGLDSVTGEWTRGAAIAMLQRLAAGRQFQPESEPAPIQVLGVFEASGMAFDHLWIIGMHDGAWPRSAGPNPFLPLRLQRDGNLPQSSPRRELEFTSLLTEQLLASSANVVVSYPKKESDADLRSSPLFSNLPEVSSGALDLPDSPGHAKLLLDSSKIEMLDSDKAPPWNGARFLGGTAIFTKQAACPFQAFAKVRLGAERLETARPGLSPLDRGNLIHDALLRVWREFGSHETLVHAGLEYRDAVIRDAVQASILEMASRKRALCQPRFASIEQSRLERLVREWLDVEKQRQPFQVVRLEEQRHVNVGGIDLDIRADRVDKLDDGTYVVIDYKSGSQSARKWDGNRPDEPQLPLYAVTSEFPLSGVVFGIAKLGEMKFSGATSADGIVPGVKADSGDISLSGRIQGWHSVLNQLASDFRSGHAAVDPKNVNQTCRNCGLDMLCRVGEAKRGETDAEADDSTMNGEGLDEGLDEGVDEND